MTHWCIWHARIGLTDVGLLDGLLVLIGHKRSSYVGLGLLPSVMGGGIIANGPSSCDSFLGPILSMCIVRLLWLGLFLA